MRHFTPQFAKFLRSSFSMSASDWDSTTMENRRTILAAYLKG